MWAGNQIRGGDPSPVTISCQKSIGLLEHQTRGCSISLPAQTSHLNAHSCPFHSPFVNNKFNQSLRINTRCWQMLSSTRMDGDGILLDRAEKWYRITFRLNLFGLNERGNQRTFLSRLKTTQKLQSFLGMQDTLPLSAVALDQTVKSRSSNSITFASPTICCMPFLILPKTNETIQKLQTKPTAQSISFQSQNKESLVKNYQQNNSQ